MTQFIHKCNRALSRLFYEGRRMNYFERLLQQRQYSNTLVTEDGELINANEKVE